MKLRHVIFLVLGMLCALPLAAQYRDDQFKRDAFTQNYADTTEKTPADTSQLFSFKEYFGGLAHKRSASLKSLTMGSTVFIGGNQIYQKQYWKLPIIYGGIGAGVGGGLYFQNQYEATGEDKYKTFSTLSYVGAGLVWWGSLLDGAINYERGKYPNPAKSTVYSILLPGLGQIYNGEAWKLPLYYGLMAGSLHFLIDNNVQYHRWKWIHNMATTDDTTVERPPQSGETAKYYRDVFRRYRDYSILAVAVSYLFQVIDANVFAYMQDFEVTDDIAFHMEPALVPQSGLNASPAVGMSVGLRF
ncbi:MAG: hypothetical protein J5835_03380 [Bacteroidales bacterium]|nr:hypothetical protein [Bacteroidales bacterium]